MKVIFLFIFCLLVFETQAQQVLDEMQINDISNLSEIKTIVFRDQKSALLVVKSTIPTLSIQSNNQIKRVKKVEPGKWFVYLHPGTHWLSFQSESLISLKKRFFFNPKDVRGVNITIRENKDRNLEKDTGIVVINSSPDTARIFLNSNYLGTTPYIGKVFKGNYRLQVFKQDYHLHERDIIIHSGRTLPINIKLYHNSVDVEKINMEDFESSGITSTIDKYISSKQVISNTSSKLGISAFSIFNVGQWICIDYTKFILENFYIDFKAGFGTRNKNELIKGDGYMVGPYHIIEYSKGGYAISSIFHIRTRRINNPSLWFGLSYVKMDYNYTHSEGGGTKFSRDFKFL